MPRRKHPIKNSDWRTLNMKRGWLWRDLSEQYGLDRRGVLNTVKRAENMGATMTAIRRKLGKPRAPTGDYEGK